MNGKDRCGMNDSEGSKSDCLMALFVICHTPNLLYSTHVINMFRNLLRTPK